MQSAERRKKTLVSDLLFGLDDAQLDAHLSAITTEASSPVSDVKELKKSSVSEYDIARIELKQAEAKTAHGIEKLFCATKHLTCFDKQGIATIELKKQDVRLTDEIKSAFPQGLKNGITIHYLKKGHIQHPPLRYMIKQKIKSLYAAAKAVYEIVPIGNESQEALFIELDEHISRLQATRADFLKNAESLMRAFIKKSLLHLYHSYSCQDDSDLVLDDQMVFVNKIMEATLHARTTEAILTFNEATQRFSFDEGADIAAHDRGLYQLAANLSWFCDGEWDVSYEAKSSKTKSPAKYHFVVTSSAVKHASLAPLDALHSDTSRVDILLSTYNHMCEVIAKLAAVRFHGRKTADQHKPMQIAWVYHLVTSNGLNKDKQATSYGYIIRAAQLLDGTSLTIGLANGETIKVTPTIYVLNSGINQFAGESVYQRKKLERENTKTYLYLSKMLDTFTSIDKAISMLDAQCQMGDIDFSQAECLLLRNGLNGLMQLQAEQGYESSHYHRIKTSNVEYNQQQFHPLADQYWSKKSLLYYDLPKSKDEKKDDSSHEDAPLDVDDIEQFAEFLTIHDEACEEWQGDLAKAIDKTKTVNHQLGELNEKIKQQAKLHWQAVEEKTAKSIDFLKNGLGKSLIQKLNLVLKDPSLKQHQQEAVYQLLTSITVSIYKAYLDKLFYSGDYQGHPKKAALFHTYCLAYERLLGVMTSMGCKSANDRTYVMRLFFAALQSMDLTMPPNLTKADEYDRLIEHMNDHAMSSAALFSCIDDTVGGTPKINNNTSVLALVTNNYPYLDGIEGLKDKISEIMGDYAPHKLQHNHALFKDIFQTPARLMGTPPVQMPFGVATTKAITAKMPAIPLGQMPKEQEQYDIQPDRKKTAPIPIPKPAPRSLASWQSSEQMRRRK